MTDDELIGYAAIHCETDRALFHTKHARQLLTLADLPIPEWLQNADTFIAIHEDEMAPILAAIRKRRQAQREQAAASSGEPPR